jgi:hypothetical protein
MKVLIPFLRRTESLHEIVPVVGKEDRVIDHDGRVEIRVLCLSDTLVSAEITYLQIPCFLDIHAADGACRTKAFFGEFLPVWDR